MPHPPYPHLTSHLSAIPCTIALVVPYEYYPWSNLSKAAALYTHNLSVVPVNNSLRSGPSSRTSFKVLILSAVITTRTIYLFLTNSFLA